MKPIISFKPKTLTDIFKSSKRWVRWTIFTHLKADCKPSTEKNAESCCLLGGISILLECNKLTTKEYFQYQEAIIKAGKDILNYPGKLSELNVPRINDVLIDACSQRTGLSPFKILKMIATKADFLVRSNSLKKSRKGKQHEKDK